MNFYLRVKPSREDPSPAGRTNISLIPYVAGGHSEDREVDPAKTTNDLQAGFDAKIGASTKTKGVG